MWVIPGCLKYSRLGYNIEIIDIYYLYELQVYKWTTIVLKKTKLMFHMLFSSSQATTCGDIGKENSKSDLQRNKFL